MLYSLQICSRSNSNIREPDSREVVFEHKPMNKLRTKLIQTAISAYVDLDDRFWTWEIETVWVVVAENPNFRSKIVKSCTCARKSRENDP